MGLTPVSQDCTPAIVSRAMRIGQRAIPRMVNLPAEYRGEYVDDARVYYGYDNGRVYQIDRQSKMILALLDIAG